MKRLLRNHSCQIPKLTSRTETATAVVSAIIASVPGLPRKGPPDRENQRAEAQGNTDATEFEPDLQYGIMRMDRQSLARQRNAIGPVGSVALMDDHLRGATG
jgi:hypothetical protein